MKNLKWLIIMSVLVSCSKGEKIKISGTVENGIGSIYLDQQGLREIVPADSVKLKQDGSFVLSDRIELPVFYNLHLGNQQIIPLLIHPGESVEISTQVTGFSSDYEIKGSLESSDLKDLNSRLTITNLSLDSIQSIFEENPEMDEEALAELTQSYNEIIQVQRRYSINFVLEHLTSLTSIYALYQRLNNEFVLSSNRDIQLLKITAQSLDTIYPESEFVISLKKDAENMENSYNNQKIRNILKESSTSLPEIRLPDPKGDTIALTSLQGQVILLSFWASWNEPSININQDFKRLYEKYHGKGLEIYQVSFDSKLSEWTQAIHYDELPWINVSELSYPESRVASSYNVTEIPMFFLIDRKGDIVGKNYGKVELEQNISELINQTQ